MKWIFDVINSRVVTENDRFNIFYTDKLDCPDSVIENVVKLHNENVDDKPLLGSEGIIDTYLLNESTCTQEEREFITEEIYLFFNPEF